MTHLDCCTCPGTGELILCPNRFDFVLSKYSLSVILEAIVFWGAEGAEGVGSRRGGVVLAVELHHHFSPDVTSLMKYLRERADRLLKAENENSSFLTRFSA